MKTQTFQFALEVEADARFPEQWIADYVRQVLQRLIEEGKTKILTEAINCKPK